MARDNACPAPQRNPRSPSLPFLAYTTFIPSVAGAISHIVGGIIIKPALDLIAGIAKGGAFGTALSVNAVNFF